MKKGLPPILCVVLLLVSAPAMAQGRSSETEVAALAEQISNVNRSLGEITRVLEALLSNQKVSVVLDRIQLEERRLDPLGSELRGARATVRGIEEEIARLENLLEQQEKLMQRRLQTGADTEADTEMKRHIEGELNLRRQNLEAEGRRVRELEDDLGRGRDKIAILDDQLRELLDAP